MSLFNEVVIYWRFDPLACLKPCTEPTTIFFEYKFGGKYVSESRTQQALGENLLDKFKQEFCEKHPEVDPSLIRFEEGYWKEEK